MKNLALLLLLTTHLFAQSTQENCQQNACRGYGPPSGACSGAYIYSDISVTPVQAYSCKSNAWALQGGNGGATLPANLTVVATNSSGAAIQATAIPQVAVAGLPTIQTGVTANTATLTTSQLQGLFYASPCSSTGAPGYRVICATDLPVFGASGGSHAIGAVPDPGASAGTTRYLREDGTWTAPVGGVTSVFGRSGAVLAVVGDYSFSLLSGSLTATQMPALTGDVTSAAGTTATTVTQVNGVAPPPTGSITTVDAGGHFRAVRQIAGLWSFCDSYCQGVGSSNAFQTGFLGGHLRNATPAPFQTFAESGTPISRQVLLALANFAPNPLIPSVTIAGTWLNDTNIDTCGQTAGTLCTKAATAMGSALINWLTVPFQCRVMASVATRTGTTALDTTMALYSNPFLASPGTAIHSTASGSTFTFTTPSTCSNGFVGINYVVANGATGAFTATLDGAALTDQISGTTTFSSTPATTTVLTAGSPATTNSVYRQAFAATAGVAHTIVITAANSNSTAIIAVDSPPDPTSIANTNSNAVFMIEPPNISSFGTTLTYYNLSAALIAAERAAGTNVFPIDTRGGTPGMNNTTDVATTSTTSCGGGNAGHPNDCGHFHLYQTVHNSELANNFIFEQWQNGGKTSMDGYIFGGLHVSRAATAGLTLAQAEGRLNYGFNAGSFGQDGGGVGIAMDSYFTNAGLSIGPSYTQGDTSTGKPWSGATEDGSTGTGNGNCWAWRTGNNSLVTMVDGSFVTHGCFWHATGELSMDGYITAANGTTIATGVGVALTIAPTAQITPVSGTGSIDTITLPLHWTATYNGCMKLFFTGAAAWTTAGNILAAGTATANTLHEICYIGTLAKWNVN